MKRRILIMGAAGRDFHNFNMLYRSDPACEVVAFTAAQIPFIGDRTYPPELSGPLYPRGVPIHPEEELAALIKKHKVDGVVFSYSDVSHEYVMHRASLCMALGADFILPGAEKTMLESRRPVISVCAVRTGCGKSGITRFAAKALKDAGRTPVVIRHPMPYGDLRAQKAQRFAAPEDMRAASCTIEEMEEYEHLIEAGVTVYAGVDYRAVLEEAEKEGGVIIWDGGNNDLPFIRPGLELVAADPHRAGHELKYYPGEANIRRARCVIINKADTAPAGAVEEVRRNVRSVNPGAEIVLTASKITVEGPIEGKDVLVIEDGPTLTHGGMEYGAGTIAARAFGARPVDVRPYAVGSIRETLDRFPRLERLLPAMGYSKEQVRELEETVERTPCDCVLIATPVNLANVIRIRKKAVRVRYDVADMESPGLKGVVDRFIEGLG
ncbi:MAG: GTPase [Deltaproteobacteria bacterium]|nr:GTPase [Deltaproteobacteria bacterium]